MSTFTTECYQNEYLPLGGSEVNAIVTVTSDGAAGETSQREAAEIVIIDTSGSMGAPRRKLESAREATSVAIDCIRDGVAFGVIAGTEVARAVYPTDGTLVIASAQTRAEAKRALRRLKAAGRDRDRIVADARRDAVRDRARPRVPRDPAHRRREPARDR